jgi:hypothetical protein
MWLSQITKRVVMIAYSFPPEGNAGAYRPLRFTKQLPRLGWMPTVISAIPPQYERHDPALSRMVPDEIEVIRINASDPWQTFQAWRSGRLKSGSAPISSGNVTTVANGQDERFRTWLRGIIRTAEAWSYHPDMASPWIKSAVDAAIAVCKRKEISVIWATAGPVSSFYIARLASLKTGIPYVMDFRDAWTITHNEFEARRPLWATRRDRKQMYELLCHAQAVTFRYDIEAECFWRAYRGAPDASKVYIIPNGYELPIEKFTAPRGERCIILYAGILSDYRYDSLLTALKILKESDPALAKHLCLRFIGEGMDVIANEAKVLGLSDMIQTTGPKPYAEVAGLQREAHALLVLGRPASKTGYELFAAAKLFGYLKAGRPIIGVLPEDETKKVLLHVGAHTVADVNSTTDIVRILRLVFDNWSLGTLSSLLPDPKACERYSSEKQAEILVRALEGVAPAEPFLPGAQVVPPSLRDRIEAINDWMASR